MTEALRKKLTNAGRVLTSQDRQALRPGLVSHPFARRVARATVRRLRLHDLRHTCARL